MCTNRATYSTDEEELDLTRFFQQLAREAEHDVAPGLSEENHRLSIKARFQEIVRHWFAPAPTAPDVWFLKAPPALLRAAEASPRPSFDGRGSLSRQNSSSASVDDEFGGQQSSVPMRLNLGAGLNFGLFLDTVRCAFLRSAMQTGNAVRLHALLRISLSNRTASLSTFGI